MTKNSNYTFDAEVRLYTGQSHWQYALVPKDVAKKIEEHLNLKKKKSQIRVEVTLDGISWKSKLFDHSELKGYLLPLGASVSSKNIGDKVHIELNILERAA